MPFSGFFFFLVCPKTLMSQSRLVIRGHIPSTDKDPAIQNLDIPQILRNYLKHDTCELTL